MLKLVVLSENTACSDNFGCEHGLSLYIETENKKILFDMGQTDLFSVNAEKAGVDLNSVDFAVLSHGHYDHGGGLKKFLEINLHAPVYVSNSAFGLHYNGTEKYIGLDSSLENEKRLIYTCGKTQIDNGITLFDCNSSEQTCSIQSGGLNIKTGGVFYPDPFLHEQYLLLEDNGRKVLFSGCSHKGILNIIEWFKPDVFVGGFHFSKLSPDGLLKDYSQKLASYKTAYYTCHCTGTVQFDFMKKYIDKLEYISTGNVLVL